MPPLTITSRQRMLAALRSQPVDHVPCSFMLFKGLWTRSTSYLDFIQEQLDMGLDAYVQLPPRNPGLVSDTYNLYGLQIRHDPRVTVREWKQTMVGETVPLLVKEYDTPEGILRAEVRQDDGWPYGDHVPFLDDYVETRSRKFIVDSQEDLNRLRYLLVPPTPEEVRAYQEEAQPCIDFALRKDLLLAGGWGVGADLVGWVYGLQKMIYAAFDHPQFLAELLEIIRAWNHARMQVVLASGVDLYIKRAWYENCDFWSPRTWRKFIFPILKSDADLAHTRGALFGYLITANCMPLLDMIAEAGVDVVIGVDPARWDLPLTRQKLSGKVCLWGGVNGHLTVEQDSPDAVRSEVQLAMGDDPSATGLILSPVDNVRELTETSTRNVEALIMEWKRMTGQ